MWTFETEDISVVSFCVYGFLLLWLAMVKPILHPPIGHPLGPGLSNVLEQLERHCLAPDGSLMSRSAFLDLTQV